MKIFSVEEANSLLPDVRAIVKAIQKAHRGLQTYQAAVKEAAAGAEHGGGGMVGGSRYAVLLTELSLRVNELESLGVQLKDYSRGLIDFPSLRDGRVVLLCWQLGEGDSLQWWHDVEGGFAGRQPL
ncbi:MAG: DUF2203 domain-containing protein [Pyrinomonadaceae bacterium]